MSSPLRNYWFAASLALVIALTLVSGVLHGRFCNRWGTPEEMRAAGAKLEGIPNEFGGSDGHRWRMESSGEMGAGSLEMLECTGSIVRTYANTRTGEQVSVFVIVGPVGPISEHTPEVCFRGAGMRVKDPRQRIAVAGANRLAGADGLASADGQDDQFWAANFKSKDLRNRQTRVCYAWSSGGNWSAPKDARWAFVGRPYLYKVQASSDLPANADLKSGDACRSFLEDFVPAARPYLVQPSKS